MKSLSRAFYFKYLVLFLNNKYKKSNMTNNKLDPNWVTGFIDGEGCFCTSLTKSKYRKIGWKIYPSF